MQRRHALVLEYQGARYGGYQVQPGIRTVQGEVEKALERLLGTHVKTHGAGRTDAGTHALGQVVAFTTEARYPSETFARALNATLPPDIRVQAAYPVDLRFDPRRGACSRTYRYLVLNRPRPSALWRELSHHVPKAMDHAAMAMAARHLVGEHHRPPFAPPDRRPRSPQRVFRADVLRRAVWVALEVVATSFYLHQVRRMAGGLVQVGLGRLSAEGFQALAKGDDHPGRAPALPARGLYLVRVSYPDSLLAQGNDEKEDCQEWLPQR